MQNCALEIPSSGGAPLLSKLGAETTAYNNKHTLKSWNRRSVQESKGCNVQVKCESCLRPYDCQRSVVI